MAATAQLSIICVMKKHSCFGWFPSAAVLKSFRQFMINRLKNTEKYLDHIHTRNNNPVPVKYAIQTEIRTKMKRMLQLHARGKKIVFPVISKLERLMLEEATPAE